MRLRNYIKIQNKLPILESVIATKTEQEKDVDIAASTFLTNYHDILHGNAKKKNTNAI